jgi:hypothetical protein
MNSIEILKQTYQTSLMVMNAYVGDLTDAELMSRPGEGCNHVAWQLGHLIASESELVDSICPGKGLELPAGFKEAHAKETAGCDDASKFLTKDEYVALFEKSKEATLAALSGLSEADLDKPGPEHFRSSFPTIGAVAVLITTHVMMHVGQMVPIRRKLSKPVVM